MTKKTKAAPALNWRTGAGYPEHGERTDLWAWEFLRRNPNYQADWRRFLAVADEMRKSYTYNKPYDNLSDNWETDPSRPYWIISKADDEGDMRASVFEPAAQDGESEGDYIARMRASGVTSWIRRPLSRAIGLRWGLDQIADPELSRLGILHRWESSPSGICSPGEHRNNHESSWVFTLNDLAKLLRPDPLPPDALQKARAILDQIPAAWDRRHAQMIQEDHPEKRGRFVVEFDLRVAIPEQLKHAGDWLERKQAGWKEGGGEVLSGGRKSKETPGYAVYLRVLDAIAEIGGNNATEWRKAIAAAMIPGYKPTATYDERKAHLDRASTWAKRAGQLRDNEYRRLVAMAVKPTFGDHMKALQHQK